MRAHHRVDSRRRSSRPGVTLIEMMVALAITLVMMAAVAQLFASISTSISASRASIGLSESLRSARNKLQNDLAGATATMLPPLRPELGKGYFEYIEGPINDTSAYNNLTYTIQNTVDLIQTTAGQTYGVYASANANNVNYGYTQYPSTSNIGVDTLSGDTDDILMFTTRSKDGQPFSGKFLNAATFTAVESQTAEVAWFAVPNGITVPIMNTTTTPNTVVPVPLYTLYRRVMLVAPEYNIVTENSTLLTSTPKYFFNAFDLSAHYDATRGMLLNSLADLTKRECRFAHNNTAAIPYTVMRPGAATGTAQGLDPFDSTVSLSTLTAGANPSNVTRVGEDVVLTNVLAFDVRAYDPSAPLYLSSDGATALNPADYYLLTAGTTTGAAGYWTQRNTTTNLIGYGDFVDLGYGYSWATGAAYFTAGGTASSLYFSTFSGTPLTMPGYDTATGSTTPYFGPPINGAVSNLTTYQNYMLYDTWSLHYEDTGTYTFNTSKSGANGIDDDGNGIVDDPVTPPATLQPAYAGSEMQYPAPYPVPLRGIQIKIRTYEPDSRQVREVTIVQDFLPQ